MTPIIKMNHIELSDNQFSALKELLVERIVDNMSVEDLVEYVAMDLDKYYDDMLDQTFWLRPRTIGKIVFLTLYKKYRRIFK